ncbi:helix-turn-helix domain-containing protein [Candidatus Gottesmanbacteria bacterium]|nr:helix-turn-helix domain-containing protein [Candidatus Gottesmanbacteria bacterium]
MTKRVTEASYPIEFRAADARKLGESLAHHDSVVLIGAKRVGISNFLRFFLYHEDIGSIYIRNGTPHLFITVDLNDLVERNIVPFWTLLLTRLVDSVQGSPLPEAVKRQCRRLFVQSIQLKDLFFTVDSVQKVLAEIVAGGLYPTIFLIRFDRMSDVASQEFFNNLQGLKEAAHQKLSYVFTSYRPLYDLSPRVFPKSVLSVFARDMFLTPAKPGDMKIIFGTLAERYHTSFTEDVRDALVILSGGHVQYLHLAILRLQEEKNPPPDLLTYLVGDEQIQLLSEELFESLTKIEKETVIAAARGDAIDITMRRTASYLWNTGIVSETQGKQHIFSSLFAQYLGTLATGSGNGEFTKKEHSLVSFLQSHLGDLCERDAIIEAVWPESKDMGVSDWAIDRLVARVRSKLKDQKSSYEVLTVKTRGYKLIKK